MATIDDLIARITDENLRQRIAEQVRLLTDRKDFGLVFQDHTPEAIEVPGLAVRRDDIVRYRGNTDQSNFVVQAVTKDHVNIQLLSSSGERAEQAVIASPAELVAIRDFGDPIYAGLKELAAINRGGNKPWHVVIQGENYYALEALLYTHESKVDVIYIDPPYNTGTSSWIYNDKFVDSGDEYRHSKWLAFMKRRLDHAKRLLKDTGVIVIAIDDTEHARLKLIADDVFGEQNFIANVVWTGGRQNDTRFVSVSHDYMLIFAKSKEQLTASAIRWREPKDGVEAALRFAAEAMAEFPTDINKANQFYRALMKKAGLSVAIRRFNKLQPESGRPHRDDRDMSAPDKPETRSFRPLIHPKTKKPCAVPERGWAVSDETMDDLIDAGLVVFGDDESRVPTRYGFLDEQDRQAPDAVFSRDRNSSARYLTSVLGSKDFPFPKDVDVIARWINIVSAQDPNAVVLDFFAGTGTTAEAVMRLNANDGGRRQSIIVTNNEVGASSARKLRKEGFLPGDTEWEAAGVFQKVTRPRVETVVTGTRPDGSPFSEGLAENVVFVELTYEDPDLIELGRKFNAIARLLWLKAGAVGGIIDQIPEAGYAFNSGDTYAVLFDVSVTAEFTAALKERVETMRHAFIVTNQESSYQQVIASLPGQSDSFQTTRLYSDYLRTFEINGGD